MDAPYVCSAPVAVDGDTLRCGSARLRLLGIDAPELYGCPNRRACGHGQASRQSLIAALRSGPVRYQLVMTDTSGRSFVMAWAGKVNLSCWQLDHNQAVYQPHWDNRFMAGSACWRGD